MHTPLHTPQISPIACFLSNLRERSLRFSLKVGHLLSRKFEIFDSAVFEETLVQIEFCLIRGRFAEAIQILTALVERKAKINFVDLTPNSLNIIDNDLRDGKLQELLLKIVPDLPNKYI